MILRCGTHFHSQPKKYFRAIEPLLDRVLSNAWLSYGIVGALQLKLIWDIWRFRDLTAGDTSYHFARAYDWYEHFIVNFAWSPLYTAFYGTVLIAAHGDVYQATIFHRAIIVMAAAFAVLAIMRKVLPAELALLVAAWWAILPINFNTLYEVHLFALLPILAAYLVVAAKEAPWMRGSGLAILTADAVLVRNEQVVAVAAFAVICGVWEYLERGRKDPESSSFRNYRGFSYVLPLSAAGLLSALFYWRSAVKLPQLSVWLDAKHALNMCQVYAFGYAQRHPEWDLSPWLECSSLMQTTFGVARPSLTQMFRNNPAAVFHHFLWNASLIFSGFETALFNRISGTVDPDYSPVIRNTFVFWFSVLAIAIMVAAAMKAAQALKYWWRFWFRDRRAVFLVMAVELCVAVPVILTQRPRPSYLFPATVVVLAAIGLAVFVLLGNTRLIFVKIAAIVTLPTLLIFVPSYYVEYKSGRPLYDNYLRLRPFSELIGDPRNRILFGDYNGELTSYLHLQPGHRETFDYGILSSREPQQTLDQFLDSRKINVVFVQPRVMSELRARQEAQQLFGAPQSIGWTKLAPTDGETNWLLLYREPHP
jgi:hypothetical protein